MTPDLELFVATTTTPCKTRSVVVGVLSSRVCASPSSLVAIALSMSLTIRPFLAPT